MNLDCIITERIKAQQNSQTCATNTDKHTINKNIIAPCDETDNDDIDDVLDEAAIQNSLKTSSSSLLSTPSYNELLEFMCNAKQNYYTHACKVNGLKHSYYIIEDLNIFHSFLIKQQAREQFNTGNSAGGMHLNNVGWYECPDPKKMKFFIEFCIKLNMDQKMSKDFANRQNKIIKDYIRSYIIPVCREKIQLFVSAENQNVVDNILCMILKPLDRNIVLDTLHLRLVFPYLCTTLIHSRLIADTIQQEYVKRYNSVFKQLFLNSIVDHVQMHLYNYPYLQTHPLPMIGQYIFGHPSAEFIPVTFEPYFVNFKKQFQKFDTEQWIFNASIRVTPYQKHTPIHFMNGDDDNAVQQQQQISKRVYTTQEEMIQCSVVKQSKFKEYHRDWKFNSLPSFIYVAGGPNASKRFKNEIKREIDCIKNQIDTFHMIVENKSVFTEDLQRMLKRFESITLIHLEKSDLMYLQNEIQKCEDVNWANIHIDVVYRTVFHNKKTNKLDVKFILLPSEPVHYCKRAGGCHTIVSDTDKYTIYFEIWRNGTVIQRCLSKENVSYQLEGMNIVSNTTRSMEGPCSTKCHRELFSLAHDTVFFGTFWTKYSDMDQDIRQRKDRLLQGVYIDYIDKWWEGRVETVEENEEVKRKWELCKNKFYQTHPHKKNGNCDESTDTDFLVMKMFEFKSIKTDIDLKRIQKRAKERNNNNQNSNNNKQLGDDKATVTSTSNYPVCAEPHLKQIDFISKKRKLDQFQADATRSTNTNNTNNNTRPVTYWMIDRKQVQTTHVFNEMTQYFKQQANAMIGTKFYKFSTIYQQFNVIKQKLPVNSDQECTMYIADMIAKSGNTLTFGDILCIKQEDFRDECVMFDIIPLQ